MNRSTQICPQCGSKDIHYRKKRTNWICDDCDHIFSNNVDTESGQDLNVKYPSRNIFISYGHSKFSKLANYLKVDLEKRGHKVWIDHELKAGNDWEQQIENALDNIISNKPNSCFLFLMCPHAVRKPNGYCLNELSVAVSNEVFIIPIKLTNITPPLSIARIQWIDFIGLDSDIHKSSFEEKKNALINALENDNLDFEGNYSKLHSCLKPIHFKAEIDRYTKNFIGRKWILDDVRRWIDDSNSSKVFWINGGPGVGKTAISLWLSCCVIEEIRAWHLCQHSNAITSDPRRCILSISYFLATHLDEYKNYIAKLNLAEIANNNSATIFNELLIQPLNHIKNPETPVVLLIDALDESADEDGKNELAQFIGLNFGLLPNWIKLIVTSRPVNEVTKWFRKLKPYTIEASNPKNINDINQYIKSNLVELKLEDSVIKKITTRIIEKSEGNFLYTEYICKALLSGEMDVNNTDNLPEGLECIYESNFERRFKDKFYYRSNIAPILRIIVASYSPIPIKDILKILEDKIYYGEEQLNQISKELGSLFTFKGDYILPFHKSIPDWITSDRDSDFFISKKDGHQLIFLWGQNELLKFNSKNQYILEFFIQHSIHADQIQKAEEWLKDFNYFASRQDTLGFDSAIQLYFKDLVSLNDKSNHSAQQIFKSDLFLSLLSNNRRYFMDCGYFFDLNEMNFQKSISNESFNEFSRTLQTALLYYYYSREEYRKVINKVELITKQISQEQSSATCQIFEVLGLCFRKIGEFNKAKESFTRTISLADIKSNHYQKSIGYMNIAKIDYHCCDFENAYLHNQLGIEELSIELKKQELSDSRLIISTTLFLAEYHRLFAETCIWKGDFVKAENLLTYTKECYNNTNLKDRYYPRFLYTSAQLNIGLGNNKKAENLLVSAKENIRNKYDRGTIEYFNTLNLLSCYSKSLNKSQLIKAKNLIKLSISVFMELESTIELLEVLILEKILESITNEDKFSLIIGEYSEHIVWAEHVLNYFKKYIIQNERINNIRQWRLDTDSEQGNLLLLISE